MDYKFIPIIALCFVLMNEMLTHHIRNRTSCPHLKAAEPQFLVGAAANDGKKAVNVTECMSHDNIFAVWDDEPSTQSPRWWKSPRQCASNLPFYAEHDRNHFLKNKEKENWGPYHKIDQCTDDGIRAVWPGRLERHYATLQRMILDLPQRLVWINIGYSTSQTMERALKCLFEEVHDTFEHVSVYGMKCTVFKRAASARLICNMQPDRNNELQFATNFIQQSIASRAKWARVLTWTRGATYAYILNAGTHSMIHGRTVMTKWGNDMKRLVAMFSEKRKDNDLLLIRDTPPQHFANSKTGIYVGPSSKQCSPFRAPFCVNSGHQLSPFFVKDLLVNNMGIRQIPIWGMTTRLYQTMSDRIGPHTNGLPSVDCTHHCFAANTLWSAMAIYLIVEQTHVPNKNKNYNAFMNLINASNMTSYFDLQSYSSSF
jgi:hypothetical protein